MRDLELWRRLGDGTVTAAELCALGDQPLVRRGPFLGLVVALVEHRDPEMRAAALGVLAGSRGVTGVRAIVARLDDEDAGVRAAAVTALRATARDAPDRYTHALFHPRVDVRLAALEDVPHAASELVAYLRADPACADAARTKLPDSSAWPAAPLRLATDLFRGRYIVAGELVDLIGRTPPAELRAFLEVEHLRTPELVEAYLESLASGARTVAPGTDVVDLVVAAIAEDEAYGRPLEALVEAATSRRPRPLSRRVVAALLSRVVQHPSPALLGAAVALEPRVIELGVGGDQLAEAAAAGLSRFRWPVRPVPAQVERLLASPHARGDLALAAALAGLLSTRRLAKLEKAFGADAILDALVASDRGWDELCRLPPEVPALELRWLMRLEATRPARFVELASRALVVFTGKRLESFVDQIPRRHRVDVVLALATREVPERVSDHERLGNACRALAPRLDQARLAAIFAGLLADTRGAAFARVLARATTDKALVAATRTLDDAAARRLVEAIDGDDPLPRDRELALATAFATHHDPDVRAWAERTLATVRPVLLTPTVSVPSHHVLALDEVHKTRIASISDRDLDRALGPALGVPVRGLSVALSMRSAPAPSVAACTALLGSVDALHGVARELDRYSEDTPEFLRRLDALAVEVWQAIPELPPLAHARLFRWEAHTAALAHWIARCGGARPALDAANKLPGWLAGDTLWEGIAEVIVLARYRDRAQLASLCDPNELALYCAHRVDQRIGRHAARIIIALVEGGLVPAGDVLQIVLDRAADSDAATREHLTRLVRLDGMPEPPPTITVAPVAIVEQIRASDLDELVRWCEHPRHAIVEEAALSLTMRGEAGQARLAELLARVESLAEPTPVLASIVLWESPSALAAARALAASTTLPPQWQFHLCLGIGDRAGALAAARAPATVAWFRRRDWEALIRLGDPQVAAIALADAPHHHAYQRALEVLLGVSALDGEMRDALSRFLEIEGERPLELRRAVARRLAGEAGDGRGLPILVEDLADEKTVDIDDVLRVTPKHVLPVLIDAFVASALIGGDTACTEKRMWFVLDVVGRRGALDRSHLAQLHVSVLEQATTAAARRAAAQHAIGKSPTQTRLRRVAEVFAWGVRRGVELTGRLFSVHMTSKEKDLGHTRLDGARIFVSPLPMLRGEAYGREIVEGLLLHEIGHHVYHRGEEPQALWKQAHDEGIGHLLNLIADEHLERNLRAVDRDYGDRLKRLDAYAFQHAAQEIAVATLLQCLRGSAAPALIGTELEVAFDDKAVRVRRGAILGELERTGHPLARFARALRMGLGNRHDDPLVAAALALCGRDLRRLDMRGLYDLTRKIADLFGGSIAVASVFGGPEGLVFGERDGDVFGSGLDDDILQREVERILDPKQGRGNTKPGPRDRLQINVSPDEDFDRIHRVERVQGDEATHRKLAHEVTRHATKLRAFLDELGLRWEPQHARLSGHALDRSRLQALVTRNDPRILKARQPVRRTDLFLGVLVDCSSSMSAGHNIDRAKRFAILVSEAVRPLPGVESRFFGFSDTTIFDAGNARECSVTGLRASGGNNDAAGLFHAANVALGSARRARVLVMISDGLPTQCSVAALRGLVEHLSRRRGIVCAQVAVRPLEEECFPHHVLLDEDNVDLAVARFGRMIGDLARRVLAK